MLHRGHVYFEGSEHSKHGAGAAEGPAVDDGDEGPFAFCTEEDGLGEDGPGSLNSSASLGSTPSVSTLPFRISAAACSSASIDMAVRFEVLPAVVRMYFVLQSQDLFGHSPFLAGRKPCTA